MPHTEAETRHLLIDERLKLAGWKVHDTTQVISEYPIPLSVPPLLAGESPATWSPGPQRADYALLLRNRPAAVVEAKRTSRDAKAGQEQGLQYAREIQRANGGEPPFVLLTNGHDLHLWEPDVYPPEKVQGFPTPDDLEWLVQRRTSRRPLSVEMINTEIAGRDYQVAAIRAVLEGIEARKRRFLLVMATGTGKTRVAMGLIDVLFRAHWAKRVLFLVDRVALQEQALDAFKEHLPGSPFWPREGDKGFDPERRLYCTTYPTMLNLIESGRTPETWISPHFFDLVIADESHRSIYNIYRNVVDWFAGIKVGLTATPRDHVDHHTFKLFDCAEHDPTFAYTYEEAVDHEPPFLCRFQALKVRTKFQIDGIHGKALSIAEQKRLVAEGKDLENIDFEGSDLEKQVTNSGTNVLIVRELMERGIPDDTGTLPGKTIIFAISQGHARRLQQLFDDLYPEHAGNLARVLLSSDERVHGKGGLLDQFRTEAFPRVAISVDLLDTGVDVREVVNLVFAKPVFSYVKFWQMIGRGTRVLPEPERRKPWCTEKSRFLILDCWGNFEFFKIKPDGVEGGAEDSLPVRLFKSRLDLLDAAIAVGNAEVSARVQADLRADIAALPVNNVMVNERRADLDQARDPAFWEDPDANDVAWLRTVIAPVLRARSRVEAKALRFETDLTRFATARLGDDIATRDTTSAELTKQVAELPLSVNLVKREEALIRVARDSAWWEKASDKDLSEVAHRLAPLMRFRRQRRSGMTELDLVDEVLVRETIEGDLSSADRGVAAWRERMEALIREMLDQSPALRKVRDGEPLSSEEIASLAEDLRSRDPALADETVHYVHDLRSARFVELLRNILAGAERGGRAVRVTEAFDGFIAAHAFTEAQIRFLQTLRTFLVQKGRIERRNLTEPPFTQLHPRGARGLFRKEEIDEILAFAERLVA